MQNLHGDVEPQGLSRMRLEPFSINAQLFMHFPEGVWKVAELDSEVLS